MSKRTNDLRMLEESVNVVLLKEAAPAMTLSQIRSNIDLMSEAEAEYIHTVATRMINEMSWAGGLRNLGKAFRGDAQKAVDSGGEKAKGMVDTALDYTKKIGKGIGGAASQLGKNVKDIYTTGAEESKSEKWKEGAKEQVEALIQYLKDGQANGMIEYHGDIEKLRMDYVVDRLLKAHQKFVDKSQAARDNGVVGGVRSAFRTGFQS